MDRMKYILQSANVLNVLLIAGIIVMVCFIVIPAHNPDINSILPQVKDQAVRAPLAPSTQARPPVLDYAVISDQNIFNPERKIPPEKKDEKAVPRPEVILYGTLITDRESVAFVEDRKAPRTTPGRGKRQMALHKGDNLSGYILRDITANNIVLVKGEEKIVVRLDEGEKRKASETSATPAAAAPVMSGSPQSPSTVQKVAGPATSQSPVAGPAGLDKPASWPTTRRGKLEEIQKKKAERQNTAP